MEKLQQRYNYIDWIKTIGIFLMIFGHISTSIISAELIQFIYSFHMPLFFIISGILFKPKGINEGLKKDFHGLIIPYLIINFFCFIWWFILDLRHGEVSSLGVTPIIQRIGAILLGIGYNTDFWKPVCGPGWFLIAIFFVKNIVNYIYSKQSRFLVILGCIILPFIFAAIFKNININLRLPVYSAIMAIPFFLTGIYLKQIQNKILNYSRFSLISLIIAFLLITLYINKFNGRIDINTTQYGKSILAFYICGICGSLMILSLGVILNKCMNKFVLYISNGTLALIGFSSIAIKIGFALIGLALPMMILNNIVGVFITVLIMVIFYPIIHFLMKYFPIILGKKN